MGLSSSVAFGVTVSLRLGHARGLTSHRDVIGGPSRRFATPQGKANSALCTDGRSKPLFASKSPPLQPNVAAPPLQINFALCTYSMFCICSRIFSSSVLTSTTSFAIDAFAHFEPTVFISRFISCNRKSRLRPTGSSELR